MISVLETIDGWVARGDRVALATVVATKKSAPQPPGTKMALNDRRQVVGAVSGGCVEGAVIEVAERILAGAPPELLHYGFADEDGWEIGLPCGGEITIWVELYDGAGLAGRFSGCARSGARAALVTAIDGGPEPGANLLVPADGKPSGTLGDAALDAAALELAREQLWSDRSELFELERGRVFVDVAAPPPRLIIVGAVDAAVQLTAVAALADWRPFVIDPRTTFATAERFPAAEQVIAAWPQVAFAQLEPIDRASAIAVLTNDPKLDDAALTAALQTDAGYIGAMGSRTAQASRRERLLAGGVQEEQLAGIAAPIGLDLGALNAAETALSIMSEIVAVRHGRSGGRLIDANGRIHAAAPA
jgi:xanthine dehydrogenase accessory factor